MTMSFRNSGTTIVLLCSGGTDTGRNTPVTEVAGPSEMQESQPRQSSPLAGPAAAPLSTQVLAEADPL
jgi:hypothetical protein